MGICESDKNSQQLHNNFSNNQIENMILQGKANTQKQNFITGRPAPSSIEKEVIINEQMKKFICKIILNNKYGTGFICKIPYPNQFIFLPVLITNKSVINTDELQRFKMLDITKIIYKILKLNKFLETNKLDKSDIENLNTNNEKDPKESKNMSYVLQYQNGINCIESHGIINKIEGDFISHNCSKNIVGTIREDSTPCYQIQFSLKENEEDQMKIETLMKMEKG